MTSMQRVLRTLGHTSTDRVPFFLLLTMHGARALDVSIERYFSSWERVVEGQLRLRARYQHDCLYPFFYAALEVQAFGGDVLFSKDGPPNAGAPIIQAPEQILDLVAPSIDNPHLRKVCQTITGLKAEVGESVPIIGVVISPFSLPVMQMGFEAYLDLIHQRLDLFNYLMAVNQAHTVAWGNAQLAAGATAICYFDPFSSPTVTTPTQSKSLGLPIAKQTIAQLNGPVAVHFAGGRIAPLLDDIMGLETPLVAVGQEESLAEIKQSVGRRFALMGNLNGILMRRWSLEEVDRQVRDIMAIARQRGGLILADNHGEIPWQVSDETLMWVSEAARRWGNLIPHGRGGRH